MDQSSSSNTFFDFNSQAGVMSLLASVRASDLSTAEKNELRDLIFLYTNGGGDASIKITLEQKLSAHKIQPNANLSKSNKTTNQGASIPATIHPFGSSRPAPVFAVPTVKERENTPASASAPIVTPNPTPVSTPVPEVVAPATVTTPPVPVSPVEVPKTGSPNYLDRIREIKTAVNSKVGNPVNLVDINNEVGREYMNALLEAMKSLSGGVSSKTETAMTRLEIAYLKVEMAIKDHQVGVSTPQSPGAVTATVIPVEPVTTPVAPPASIPEVPVPASPPPPPPPPIPVASVPVAPALSEVPVKAEELVVPVSVTPTEIQQAEVTTATSQNPAALEQESDRWSEPVVLEYNPEAPSAPKQTFDLENASAKIIEPASDFVVLKQDNNKSSDFSVLTDTKVLTPQDLPSNLSTEQAADPLFTPEIDAGLQQLLSDWSLFKKSGLFGTGPKGVEHPLFKKISSLPVHLLLAGRFEGSTQEIKQSITDYMNGWRYEQGIIYEQGETFEYYLRRVIRQILDLQKKV